MICKVKDNNNVSGKGRKSCPFYDEIDSILGTRAASQPVILLDSGTEQCDSGAVAKELDDQAFSDFVEEQSKNWLACPFDLFDCPGTDTNEGDDSLFGFNEPEPEDGNICIKINYTFCDNLQIQVVVHVAGSLQVKKTLAFYQLIQMVS